MQGKGGINTRHIGSLGERIAADFLLQKGYIIIEKNFLKKDGEIDIIAWHEKKYFGRTLCFIEVKFRSREDGSAERSVDQKKQKNMLNSARRFCLEHGIDSNRSPIQFEQISIYGAGNNQKIYHYDIFQ